MKVDISRDSLICILSRNGLYYPCCSSQEEQVLKPIYAFFHTIHRASCSSQEEQVLKPRRDGDENAEKSCSSQEEQVLKQCVVVLRIIRKPGCSSQEEQVLKQGAPLSYCSHLKLLLARGAGIETSSVIGMIFSPSLLLARGAGIETLYAGETICILTVAPRKRSRY